jgi:ubiquinone biosynthesis protein
VNEISFVLAKNGFGHVLNLVGLTNPLPAGSQTTETGPFARRVRQALVQLGPTFVKLGQVLSVRPDILPQDVLSEFESLQDRVPPMAESDVRHVLERELGGSMDAVFSDFSYAPLGSASIAQVHAATLNDGREVAVKIQRRGIERRIRSDIHILYSLAQLLEGRVTVPGLHTPTAVVREFDQAITAELDFLTELRSAERLGRHVADLPGVKVPEVYPRWSTGRLLVMELIDGQRLSDRMREADEAARRDLAHAIMEATYRQVFEYGFFHGDPHPGNLLVTPDGTLAYIDFGVVGTLTGAMQDTLIQAFTSMVFRDAETLALTVYRAGATSGRVDLRAFQAELEKKMVQYFGASLDDLANPTTFMEVIEMCTRFRISLPPEFAVLSRAITLVEAEIRELLPGVDIVEEVRPYAQRLMTRRFSPDRVALDAAKMMVQAQGHFRDLPTHLSQVLMDLEGGQLSIITRDPDAAQMRAEIRLAVLRLSLAALASVTTLGSLLFLAAWSPTPFGVPVFGLVGVFTLGGGLALFGALGIHVFFARFLNFALWRRRALAVLRFFSWRRDR